MAASSPQVVVVGAGMAGLAAIKELGRSSAAVTLVDEHNYTTFPPLLFEAAAALISPEDVVTPIRALLAHDEQVRFRMGRVGGVDWDRGRVLLDGGSSSASTTSSWRRAWPRRSERWPARHSTRYP